MGKYKFNVVLLLNLRANILEFYALKLIAVAWFNESLKIINSIIVLSVYVSVCKLSHLPCVLHFEMWYYVSITYFYSIYVSWLRRYSTVTLRRSSIETSSQKICYLASKET